MRNIADRVGHLQLILNLGMSGSVPKHVEKLCADIECNGCNRVLPPCSNMTNTDAVLSCVALRAGLCQTQTGSTCMQLAD